MKFRITVLISFVVLSLSYLLPVSNGWAQPDRVITILQTSDVHGHIFNWDFFEGVPKAQGLALVSTIVKEERKGDSSLLLLDAGDTIQGSPLAYFFNVRKTNVPPPMAVAMNLMEYDAMTVGNHEFNYGLSVLKRFERAADFPLLSANITNDNGESFFKPYLIKEVKGLKVGILGLTTEGIPQWEKPENISGLTFQSAVETARGVVAKMKTEGCSLIVALVHSGVHKGPVDTKTENAWSQDYRTWTTAGYAEDQKNNFNIALAEACPDIDIIMGGHTHVAIPEARVGDVLIVQPYKWARGLSKVTVTFDESGKIQAKKGEFISCESMEPDPEIITWLQPYHDATLTYINQPIGLVIEPFQGGLEARWKDTPLVDLINTVQLKMAADAGYSAQISLAALFNTKAGFDKGPLTVAELHKLYQFDNTLYVMDISGDILRRALEHNASYWRQINESDLPLTSIEDLLSPLIRGYNWDMYTGIEYALDLTKPVGQRITKLLFEGKPVRPDQTFRIALNNYRAGGSNGYSMFPEGTIIWKSMSEIRDGIVDYVSEVKELDPADVFVENWHLLPESIYTLRTENKPD